MYEIRNQIKTNFYIVRSRHIISSDELSIVSLSICIRFVPSQVFCPTGVLLAYPLGTSRRGPCPQDAYRHGPGESVQVRVLSVPVPREPVGPFGTRKQTHYLAGTTSSVFVFLGQKQPDLFNVTCKIPRPIRCQRVLQSSVTQTWRKDRTLVRVTPHRDSVDLPYTYRQSPSTPSVSCLYTFGHL